MNNNPERGGKLKAQNLPKAQNQNSDLTTWSLAELIAGRDLARQFHWWDESSKINAELRRRGFSA